MKHLSILIPALVGTVLPLMAQDYGREMVPPGTQIRVRTDNAIDVAKWDRGRIYSGHVDADVYNNRGEMVIPRGSYCEMIVRQAGPDQLALDLESVTANGRRYVVDATGPQFNMDQAQYNSGAGLVGAIIGTIAGATGGNVEYRGGRIQVPGAVDLTFQLQQPLHVVTWNDEGYDRDGSHYHHYENHGWYR